MKSEVMYIAYATCEVMVKCEAMQINDENV